MIEHFHPEFGYLAPTPRLRRYWRVGLAAFASGAAIGALGMVAVSVGYREADNASARGVATEVAARAQTSRPAAHPHANTGSETTALGSSKPESSRTSQNALAVQPQPQPAQPETEGTRNALAVPGSARENLPPKITGGPSLVHKANPIRRSLARKEESMPAEADSAYARNIHGRTVFWDWSR